MTYVDDRTDAERLTHVVLVAATNSFMSGWGGAAGGTSIAVWACRPEHDYLVLRWVERRKEMKRVRIVSDPYRPRCAHCHIYVVDDNHAALEPLRRK